MKKHFIKTEISALTELAALAVVHPTASALLAVIKAVAANGENEYGGVMIGNEILQRLTSTTKPTIFKNIDILVNGGFIAVGKCGRNNVYIVNPDAMTMRAGKHETYTALDNIIVILDDDESTNIVSAILKMKKTRNKNFKQIRDSNAMNSHSVRTSNKFKHKDKILVDKETGEVL